MDKLIITTTPTTEVNTKVIKANISLCKPNSQPIIFENGKIVISDNSIIVSGCLDGQHADMFSVAYKAAIGLYNDFSKYVKYKKANENGNPIEIEIEDDTRVLSFRTSSMAKGYSELSWSLSKLSISYSSAKKENYVILNLPYVHIAKELGFFGDIPESISLTDGAHSFKFHNANDVRHSILNTEDISLDVLDAFLTHASFYFYSLCNIIQRFTYDDGKQKMIIHIPNFEIAPNFSYLSELHYITFGEEKGFKPFLHQSKWNTLPVNDMEKLKNAVYTLSRCKYCDETTEFLLLYSILDRYAGNRYGRDPYQMMKDNLAERNIDISKIGSNPDSSLQKLQLHLIRDSGKKVVVDNFCNLRNYIMHFTANANIDEFLRKSDLVSNMYSSIG